MIRSFEVFEARCDALHLGIRCLYVSGIEHLAIKNKVCPMFCIENKCKRKLWSKVIT
jgi:hypothetical protein